MAITPAWVLMYFTGLPWTGFVVGLLALAAAWFGGERFVLRQVRLLTEAARRLASGDWESRTGLADEKGELGQLARAFDDIAAGLQQRISERIQVEQSLLRRAQQQAAVAALGQFGIVSSDFGALLDQTVTLVAQTLEVEYCQLLELLPDKKSLLLQAGMGWKPGRIGNATIDAAANFQEGYALRSGEPVVVADLNLETRFRVSPLAKEHDAISGATVAIVARDRTFGVLSVYASRRREFNGDDIQFLLAIATVVATALERQRTEADLQKLALFAKHNPNPAMEIAADGAITYSNDAAQKLVAAAGKQDLRELLPYNAADIVRDCLATARSKLHLETRAGERLLSWSFHPLPANSVVHCYFEDVTDRLNLERQFRQLQKMESVGQLAAGVAHDFNNVLTVIQGHAGMLLARAELPPQAAESVQTMFSAAERAASLTRQLLTFSRKETMHSEPLDLREIVGQLNKMLKRLLGENIELEFNPPAEIPFVQGDAGMIEQVLMNLAVNARDAMPTGGKLSISTAAMAIDDTYVQQHPGARVGPFVCLRVTDTGSGMDNATLDRIFEPFFTTKEAGRGTGLGLATVYGIVKQHEGWIEVASEIGRGSTFGIYLPASKEIASGNKKQFQTTIQVKGGDETILTVEDELPLRDMTYAILRDCGYNVLVASSAIEALALWNDCDGNIDLLLADIIMPEGMSGIELATRLLIYKPALRVIFTSGYNVNGMDTTFMLKCRGNFLQKPYTRFTLAKTIRDCLDRNATASAPAIT